MDETPAQQPAPGDAGHAGTPGPAGAAGTPAAGAGPEPGARTAGPPPGAQPPPAGQPGAQPGGYPPPAGGYAPPSGRTGGDAFFDSIRRTGIVRSDERWVGGVAGGLAMRLGIDPLIVRGLFGIGALLGGVGFLVYGVCWLLLPEQSDGRIHLQQLFRGDFDAAVIGGFAAILVGIGVPDGWFMPWWDNGPGWWRGLAGFAAVVVVVALVITVLTRAGRGTGPTTSLPPRPQGAPPYGQPYAAPFAGPTGPTGPAAHPGAPGPVPPRPAYGPATPAAASPRPEGTSMSTAPPAPAPYPTYGPPHGQPGPAYGGYRPPAPQPAGPTTTLPAPRPEGPGVRLTGIVLALGLLTWAGLLYAERIDRFDHPVLLTAAAVTVILAGLGIAVAGMLGRRSGGLGGLAVLTLIFVVPIGAASYASWSNATFVGDVVYRPTAVEVAEQGYSVFAGDVVVDLTDLPLDGETVEVPVHLGAGELRVVLPEDGAYTARVRQSAGEFVWLGESPISGVGTTGWRTYESPAVADGAEPDIALEITLGAGTLRVEED